jgi:glycosyltransferase involved in cell wall biosynthesis
MINSSLTIHFLVQFTHFQGTYFRFHNLAIGLTKLGHKVTVFGVDTGISTFSAPEREEVRDGILYHIIPSYKGMSLFGGFSHPLTALRRCFIDYPPCDIAHLFQPFLSAALPWKYVLDRKAQALFYDWDDLWINGVAEGKPNSFRDYWFKKNLAFLESNLPAQATHVTTCSQFLSDLATQRQATYSSIIHNGYWPFEISDKRVAREKLNLQQNCSYVGFMGRTTHELSWCFEALEKNLSQYENLRFALCGPPESILDNISPQLRQRIDYLGNLSPLQTRDFATALDLGLLPLENNPFNQSRFPIKFAEYMAAGTPILSSEVGECSYLSTQLPWVIKAGKTKDQWFKSFDSALKLMNQGQLLAVNQNILEDVLSWSHISQKLANKYLSQLS